MNASAQTLRALWVAMFAAIVTIAALLALVAAAGLSALRDQPFTWEVWGLDLFLAFVLFGVLLWGLSPPFPTASRREAAVRPTSAGWPDPEPFDRSEELDRGGEVPPAPAPTFELPLPVAVARPAVASGVAASSILGTFEERRWSEETGSPAPPWSEDPELMRASLSFSPGLHPELRADRFRSASPGPLAPSLTPGLPPGALRPTGSGSLSRSGGRTTSGVLDRVPAPPGNGGATFAGRRMCVSCGTGLTGASTEPLCVGCGRPLCTSCYWRNGSSAVAHRCPTCLTAATHPVPESRSGGRATPPGGLTGSMTSPER